MKAVKNKYYRGGKEPLLNKARRMTVMDGIMKDADALKKLLNEPVFINEIGEDDAAFCTYCGAFLFDEDRDDEICNECYKMKFDDMHENATNNLLYENA